MPRGSGLVLGLPIPKQPIDINAPRASRKRPTNETGSGSDESPTSRIDVPPSKVSKTSASAGRATNSLKPGGVELAPAPKDAAKPKGNSKRLGGKKKKEKAALAQDAGTETTADEIPIAASAPVPKAQPKAKQIPAPDADIEMSVPSLEATTEPGTITIGDTLVPPTADKKKRRKKKVASVTASAMDMDPTSSTVPGLTEAAASETSEPVTGGVRATSRVKTSSDIAQKGKSDQLSSELVLIVYLVTIQFFNKKRIVSSDSVHVRS
jgi:hypothetical protein